MQHQVPLKTVWSKRKNVEQLCMMKMGGLPGKILGPLGERRAEWKYNLKIRDRDSELYAIFWREWDPTIAFAFALSFRLYLTHDSQYSNKQTSKQTNNNGKCCRIVYHELRAESKYSPFWECKCEITFNFNCNYKLYNIESCCCKFE